MRTNLFPAVLVLGACAAPADDTDDTEDTDVVDTDETDPNDTDGEDTDVVDTDEDDTDVVDTDVDLGTLVWSTSFEAPVLDLGAYTTNEATGWTITRNPVENTEDSAGILHVNAGLTALTPLAAPADGNQALYFNARYGGWARADTTVVAEMAAGTVYTLTAAIAHRGDVEVPSSMSVIFFNASDETAFAGQEVQLGTLADATLFSAFQPISVTYTATAEDDGEPLGLRFGSYHTGSSLSQLLVDNVMVYARE